MVTNELRFPRPEFLLENIRIYSESQPKDLYGDAVLALSNALKPYERRGTMQGFRTWLLASEYSRQSVLWDSASDLTGAPQSEIRVRRALGWLSDWPHKPGRVMSWRKMLQEIIGKTVTLANGSFRKIPTPAQIEFVRKGILDGDRAERNILVYEPQQNIACYKPDKTSVFPDELRGTMWAHIPLIDIVVRNRRFRSKSPFSEWENNHTQIRKKAKHYEPIQEFLGDYPIAWQRERAAGISGSGRIGFVWEENPNNPVYLGYSTSKWESVCRGEEKFVDMATRFLVTGQG